MVPSAESEPATVAGKAILAKQGVEIRPLDPHLLRGFTDIPPRSSQGLGQKAACHLFNCRIPDLLP